MDHKRGWSQLELEADAAFHGEGKFPLPAYSEFMPAPLVGFKPYDRRCFNRPATATQTLDTSLDINEYEQAEELKPGLARIAEHIVFELSKLVRGEPHALSKTLLEGNRAWPQALADAAHQGKLIDEPLALIMPLALSRSQDDKGNNRWTLFGISHDGPSQAFWRSLDNKTEARFSQLIAWLRGGIDHPLEGLRILADEAELPAFLKPFLLGQTPVESIHTLLTFIPFEKLAQPIQAAYLARKLTLIPSPATLIFAEHPRYQALAHALPQAQQIPLLHLFPRLTGSCAMRIPQSGWLDEHDPNQPHPHGHNKNHHLVNQVARTHRWQRIARDEPDAGDGVFTDKVTVALFSTNPDDLGLYGKPMARNAQIWTHDYQLLLDGPSAKRAQLNHASQVTDLGGRFGYRFFFPPMRAGKRELYWHFPLLARSTPATGHIAVPCEPRADGMPAICEIPLLGYIAAEGPDTTSIPIRLTPNMLSRPGHHQAATLFAHDPGRRRYTTANNVHRLLEFADYLNAPLSPALARALLRASKETTLQAWLTSLPELCADKGEGDKLVAFLYKHIGIPNDPGPAHTFESTRTRAFEEQIWRSISSLSEGEFRQKENADGVSVNTGRSGGPAAAAAQITVTERRDLDQLGDHLHARYRELIAKFGMEGKAEVVDHLFKWETEFEYQWSDGWMKNQTGEARERNIVLLIPGKHRGEAVIMGDHYDTAYMEDVYEAARGGDALRAAARGADDNHSATTALLLAAEVLLPLSRAGKLERDVWLVHLTGEEFPADCLGARALSQALIEGRLAFTRENGEQLNVAHTRVVAAFILDMVAHNSDRDRDVFQISPGEGVASAKLAVRAHLANQRWNRDAAIWNHAEDRSHLHRAVRMPDGSIPPAPFKHLLLSGEIRTEWEPRSSLYNTDGQIFSDVGIPVVLFMENYDINRTGYHDTHDTMKNIDLDYAAGLIAIAIETVVDVACSETL